MNMSIMFNILFSKGSIIPKAHPLVVRNLESGFDIFAFISVLYTWTYAFLFVYTKLIVAYIYYIWLAVNYMYSMNFELFLEFYGQNELDFGDVKHTDKNIQSTTLFMEGNSDESRFKKPKLYSHDVSSATSSTQVGEKRGISLGDENSQDSSTYIRDNNSQISSRKAADWGVNTNHDYSEYDAPKNLKGFRLTKYTEDCQQMANLLEYHRKVHGRNLVHTYLDNNPFMGEGASEFFEGFVENHNIKPKAGADCVENTTALRDLFRKYR